MVDRRERRLVKQNLRGLADLLDRGGSLLWVSYEIARLGCQLLRRRPTSAEIDQLAQELEDQLPHNIAAKGGGATMLEWLERWFRSGFGSYPWSDGD